MGQRVCDGQHTRRGINQLVNQTVNRCSDRCSDPPSFIHLPSSISYYKQKLHVTMSQCHNTQYHPSQNTSPQLLNASIPQYLNTSIPQYLPRGSISAATRRLRLRIGLRWKRCCGINQFILVAVLLLLLKQLPPPFHSLFFCKRWLQKSFALTLRRSMNLNDHKVFFENRC